MEKTVYKKELMIETISVLPRTLEIKEEKMKVGDVNSQMYVVYGHDPATRRVWCATFIDEQEAEAWIHGSKTFGRPVLGAVMAGQEDKLAKGAVTAEKGAEISDDAMVAPVDENAKPS
jgi:hypothetical protein